MKILPSLLLGAVAAFAGAASASPATLPPEAAKNVVLVHGAFVDGSGWRGVYDELTRRGYHVSVAQIPLTSLADDVAATQRILDRQDGPTILVGHSWGGVVITEVGEDAKVMGLVYVSALSPDAGETTGQQYAGFAPTPDFVIETSADGFGFLSPAKFKAGFAADVSDAQAAFMAAEQKPIRMAVFGTKLTHAAWRSRPSWAVIAAQDQAFDQAMLVRMAQRIGAQTTIVPGSHAVFMTQAKAVADVIDRAAREAKAKAKAAAKS